MEAKHLSLRGDIPTLQLKALSGRGDVFFSGFSFFVEGKKDFGGEKYFTGV